MLAKSVFIRMSINADMLSWRLSVANVSYTIAQHHEYHIIGCNQIAITIIIIK